MAYIKLSRLDDCNFLRKKKIIKQRVIFRRRLFPLTVGITWKKF